LDYYTLILFHSLKRTGVEKTVKVFPPDVLIEIDAIAVKNL
jgi:hypothetical protein